MVMNQQDCLSDSARNHEGEGAEDGDHQEGPDETGDGESSSEMEGDDDSDSSSESESTGDDSDSGAEESQGVDKDNMKNNRAEGTGADGDQEEHGQANMSQASFFPASELLSVELTVSTTTPEASEEIQAKNKAEENEKFLRLKKQYNLVDLSIPLTRLSAHSLKLLIRKAILEEVLASLARRKHRKRKHPEKEIVCAYEGCKYNQKFGTLEELDIHIKRNHEGVKKPFTCETCHKSFVTAYVLEDHRNIHRKERPHLCHLCGASFCTNSDLGGHRRKVHKIKRREYTYTCRVCTLRFDSRRQWGQHVITHPEYQNTHSYLVDLEKRRAERGNTEKPDTRKELSCNSCDFKSTSRKTLKEHKRSLHEGGAQRVCPVCNRAFKTATHYNIHVKTVHSEDRPFPCSVCGKAFKLPKDLRRHNLRVHNRDRDPSAESEVSHSFE